MAQPKVLFLLLVFLAHAISQLPNTSRCPQIPGRLPVSEQCCESPGYDSAAGPLSNNNQFNCPCKEGYWGPACDFCEQVNGRRIGLETRVVNGIPRAFQICANCRCEAAGTANCTGIFGVGAQCNCKPRFTGPQCGDCVAGFSGRQCSECANGAFVNPRNATSCCACSPAGAVDAQCYTGAFNATAVCRCKPGFTGTTCSECANGGLGENCAICPAGSVRQAANGTLACVQCQCNPLGALSNVCDEQGKCSCKSNYRGPLCSLCADGLNGPECTGNLFLQNKEVIIAVASLGLIVAGAFLFIKKKYPDAENAVLFTAVLTVVDFASDILFLVSVISKPYDFAVKIAAYVVVISPIVITLVVSSYLIITELKSNHEFGSWTKQNTIILSISGVLGSTNIEFLSVLSSKLFYSPKFSAPVSTRFTNFVGNAGLANIFIEDVPQFGVSLWVLIIQGPDKQNFQTVLVTLVSVISIIHGLLQRVFLFFARKSGDKGGGKNMDERKSMPFSPRKESFSREDDKSSATTVYESPTKSFQNYPDPVYNREQRNEAGYQQGYSSPRQDYQYGYNQQNAPPVNDYRQQDGYSSPRQYPHNSSYQPDNRTNSSPRSYHQNEGFRYQEDYRIQQGGYYNGNTQNQQHRW